MNEYTPDRWLFVKITGSAGEKPIYKLFSNWYGGYLGSDSWKLNSGITKVTESEDKKYYQVEGYSGSVYFCRKGSYGAHGYGMSVLHNFIEQAKTVGSVIEELPKDTDPMELDYSMEALNESSELKS